MSTYKEVLNKGKKFTRKHKKETSATELLLLHFSSLEPTELYLNYDQEMPEEQEDAFFRGLNRYLIDQVPVQQIIGYVYFYGHKFKVTNQALIPRFETEELVANVLILYDEYFQNKKAKLVDIGTGSGCLAIALAKEESNLEVVATDISKEAIALAKENANALSVDVEFYVGDLLEPIKDKKFDILVSNPPYIPLDEEVDELIYKNEPHLALFGGEDGLKFYHLILEKADSILNDSAIIAFEHGYDKANEIKQLAIDKFPEALIYTLKDMQKLDRMTFIIKGFEKKAEKL
ncbi:MAG: peptide chain release factor N(5)-glutamine methyltransferase [Candidatus Izimaplasma sp.]|nr:peptide chain release factor N(5)-glutamine methyltransferase [Candidatus Izimaplasma bacterium]